MATKLMTLRLSGWKSIPYAAAEDQGTTIEFHPVNLLIGANGAGKSNLIAFFEMICAMRNNDLQVYIARADGARALLHYGFHLESAIEAELQFSTEVGEGTYSFRLVPAAGDNLIFDEERLYHSASGRSAGCRGHRETQLGLLYALDNPRTDFDRCGKLISNYLDRSRVNHFHDTSLLGPMRQDCPIDNNRFLSSNGANLPALLYLYRISNPIVYRRIVAAVKAVAPFFDDFVLEPLRLKPRNIALHWRANGNTYEFYPHQLSDGTLRAIVLFTLLLQPEGDYRPGMMVLDEPELGLHPAALAVFADLAKSAAEHSQLLIATQSMTLIDHFEVDDVVTVNLRDGCSKFERLDPERLKHWLDDYSLSELWERNAIGGGPY